MQRELLEETGKRCGQGVPCVWRPCPTALQFFFAFYFKLIQIYHNSGSENSNPYCSHPHSCLTTHLFFLF